MHTPEATLAEPKRSINVDDDEPADAVHRPRCRRQDVPEHGLARQGRGGQDPGSMLHPVAEGRQDEHTDRHGEKGELRVTLLSLADQPRLNN